jgi:hypothetical protein
MSVKKTALRRRYRKLAKLNVHSVETVFYGDYEGVWLLKTNTSKYALNAALNAHKHLKKCKYWGAVLAEVYDLVTGKLYAILKVELNGELRILDTDVSLERDLQDELYLQQQHKE